MKKQPPKDIMDKIVDEILSEMPLREQLSIANMSERTAEILQQDFALYIRTNIDESGNVEFSSIMKELWKRLRENHRLRIVR